MLEKPPISTDSISACLKTEYGLGAASITFLPLGADLNTAVYRIVAQDGKPYFMRLRRGPFNEMSVAVPRYLSDRGLTRLIPPLARPDGSLWASLEPYKVVLYPYVDGQDAYGVGLSDRQWIDLGKLFRQIHSAVLPAAFVKAIHRENLSPALRESLQATLNTIESHPPQDPLQEDVWIFLREQRQAISGLIDQANRLAESLQEGSPEFHLCHGDLHAGNLLLHARGDFYLVDWDDLLLAPREKDLMSVGGGQFGGWHSPAEEEALFYQGYGPVGLDHRAITYYRFERVIADLEVECRQILDVSGDLADRQQAFNWMKSNFLPTGALSIALRAASDH